MSDIDLKDISILSRKLKNTNINDMIDKLSSGTTGAKECFDKMMNLHLKKFGHFDVSEIKTQNPEYNLKVLSDEQGVISKVLNTDDHTNFYNYEKACITY